MLCFMRGFNGKRLYPGVASFARTEGRKRTEGGEEGKRRAKSEGDHVLRGLVCGVGIAGEAALYTRADSTPAHRTL